MTLTANPPEPIGFSIRDVCATTSLGRTTIYSLIAAGKLEKIKIGSRSIITGDSLRRLMEAYQ